jgi:hypothetical protein
MTGALGNDLRKSIIINHPDMGLVVIGNFDVTAQDISVSFPTAGTWYDYLGGATFTATGGAQTINLQPGEYRVYTSQLIAGGGYYGHYRSYQPQKWFRRTVIS